MTAVVYPARQRRVVPAALLETVQLLDHHERDRDVQGLALGQPQLVGEVPHLQLVGVLAEHRAVWDDDPRCRPPLLLSLECLVDVLQLAAAEVELDLDGLGVHVEVDGADRVDVPERRRHEEPVELLGREDGAAAGRPSC
jgi:hypothetical protein